MPVFAPWPPLKWNACTFFRTSGVQPKRADVLPAGALLFETALAHLGVGGARVSDRGVRWGVLLDRWETLG